MEDNRAWDVGASATAIGQEVRKNSKNFDKPIQGFLSLGTLRTQDGGGATQLHSFQPGGFSSLLHSFVRILHICRWTQRLRWSERTRMRRTQRILKLRYQNGLLLIFESPGSSFSKWRTARPGMLVLLPLHKDKR